MPLGSIRTGRGVGQTVLYAAVPLFVAFFVALIVRGLAFDADGAAGEAADSVWSLAAWSFGVGAVVALGLLYYVLSSQSIYAGPSGPVAQLLIALRAGDATAVEKLADDELRLSREASGAVRELLGREEAVHKDLEKQSQAAAEFATTIGDLMRRITEQVAASEEVELSLDEDSTAQRNLSSVIDSLSHSAEESSSSVLEMVAINNEVRENVHNLASSVQETTTAIEEMTFSSKEVAKNIEDLSTAAEETAASMNEMDVSISQVETNANETSKLSETVSRDAETGVVAIKRTIEGIDKIRESSRVAAEVISSLGLKINEIGNILNVIDDVAEQTNLLALNAAIIAAQAGEHGRGFAVVADEIKALAERTGASTKEIADLIKAVQDESKNAVNVMAQGVANVAEGVDLGHGAEDALRKIVDSAKRSTLMIQAIAQATVEQAKGSKQVTNAISRIAETVQQIAFATSEQAKGSEHIMQSAESMRIITQQVERSADEQNRGGRQITGAIENIRDMAERISQTQRTQAEDKARLGTAASNLKRAGARAMEEGARVEGLARGLASRAKDMVARFG